MDDKKGVRHAGTKVSQIANIFQPKVNVREDIITIRTKTKPTSPTREVDPPGVTVMRTESHVTRFNNARALFEKLGEENRSRKDRIIPLQSTKSASSILEMRSRSSSSNSENRETKSHDGSRSPSPQRRQDNNVVSTSVPVLNANANRNKTNGHNVSEVLSNRDISDVVSKINGNDVKNTDKPALMKKPEKPERKFNSKELIEKQKNWTSHFSKTPRSSRYSSDPSKPDGKLGLSNGKEPLDNKTAHATRSASFNNKMRSPPTSPPTNLSSDVSRRYNVVRKERPASIGTPSSMMHRNKDYTSPSKSPEYISPIKSPSPISSPSPNSSPVKVTPVPNYGATYTKKDRSVFSNIYDKSSNKFDFGKLPEPPPDEVERISPLKGRSPSQDSGLLVSTTSPKSPLENKSVLEEKEASKENLSGTSGSLSSLSPPSSPTRLRGESEKQELEGNEKIDETGIVYHII